MKKIVSFVILLFLALSLLVSCSSGIKSGDPEEYIKKILEIENTKFQSDEYFTLYGVRDDNLRESVKGTDFTKPVAVYEITWYENIFDLSELPASLRDCANLDGRSLASFINARKSVEAVTFSAIMESTVSFACDTHDKEENYVYVYENVCLLVSLSASKNDVVTVSAAPFFADGTSKEDAENAFVSGGIDVKIK